MAEKATETPLMKQYFSFKSKYPDAMLLFRVGDFYETYGEDAVKSSEILGIVLTKRSSAIADSIELAGFPHHALDTYLPKLVRAGLKVAVCEQLEDPKLTKKLVKRGVVELVTPGVTYNDNVLEQKENNFLASVHLDKESSGVAFLDVSRQRVFRCSISGCLYWRVLPDSGLQRIHRQAVAKLQSLRGAGAAQQAKGFYRLV